MIRQLYYPYRQWQKCTEKKIVTLFFNKENKSNIYCLRQFEFKEPDNYNSIQLVKVKKYSIL